MRINTEEKDKNRGSNSLVRHCKSMIFKFGYGLGAYDKFLVSVKAQKEDGTVLQYSNNDMEKYYNAYLKHDGEFLSDAFILDNFKIKSRDGHDKVYETGYFCPRSFWDYIIKQKN